MTAETKAPSNDRDKSRRRRRWGILLVALLGTCVTCGGLVRRALGPSPEYPTLVTYGDAGPLCFEDVSVFPGDSTELLLHQRVVVTGDRISRVEALDAGACGGERERIEGAGRTLLPGFIDAHVHLFAPAGVPWAPAPPAPGHFLEAWLASGVTTVYDLGGPGSLLADLSASVESGEIVGPHVVHGDTPFTVPGAHPVPAGEALARFPLSLLVGFGAHVVDSPDAARAEVAAVAATGVPYIKIIRDRLPESSAEMSDEVLTALIEAAHAHDMRAVVHVGDEAAVAAAINAGADYIAHMPYRGPLTGLPRADGVHVAPTLSAFEQTVLLGRGEFSPSPLARALHPAELLDPVTGDAGRAFLEFDVLHDFDDTLERDEGTWHERVARLRAAGAVLVVGTDAPLPAILPGSAFHDEIDALARAGVPRAEIFRAATWNAATLLDADPDFGAIRAGMRADLVLLEGNPLEDPARSRDIVMVVQSGRRVVRTLR